MCRISQCAATLVLLTAAAAAAPAEAQKPDSAAFLIRLGSDTTVVERYVRTGNRIEAEAVQRSPSTVMHRLSMELGPNDRVRSARWEAHPIGGGDPLIRRTVTFGGDSATVETTQAGRTTSRRVAAKEAVPVMGPFYTPYELAIMQGLARKRPRVTLLSGFGTVDIPVERVGRDSVALTNQFSEPMRASVGPRGRLLAIHTPAYTTVQRMPWVDLPAMAREFAGRDAVGKGMGALSPRETFRTHVGNANLWVDYSRPAMRGRPIWGGLVPYDRVWRMGANDAAHLSTDRPLELGGLTLQPGTYTLFLHPTADAWQLIVSRQTGISGLAFEPDQEIGRVAMTKESIAEPVEAFTIAVNGREGEGTLSIAWDRTRASVPFRVR